MSFHRQLDYADLHAPSSQQVENKDTVAILKGQVVRLDGFGIQFPGVRLGNSSLHASFGIAQSDIAINAKGVVTCLGLMRNLNTSPWSIGTLLFCDSFGNLSAVAAGPIIAVVLRQDSIDGIIYTVAAIDFALGAYTAGDGLSLTGAQFAVDLAPSSGLQFTAGDLDHLLDGATLSKSASGLKVADSGITNTQISASAAIARSKIAAGSPNQVLVNNSAGLLSFEAQLALSRGGTNAALSASAGSIAYSTSSAFAFSGVGAAGQALLSGGTAAPTWFTKTGVVKATSGVLYTSKVSLTTEVADVLPIANGGTNSSTVLSNNRVMVSAGGAIVENTAIAPGSIYFGAELTGLPAQDNANLVWDNTNNRLGVGTNTPSETLHVQGSALFGTGSVVTQTAVSGILYFEAQAAIDTIDATFTDIYTYTVPINTVTKVEAHVIGRRTGGTSGTAGDSSAYVRTVRVNNIEGTLTLFNLQSDYTSESNTSTNCIIDVSGTTVRVRVAGSENNNYKFFAHVKILNG